MGTVSPMPRLSLKRQGRVPVPERMPRLADHSDRNQ